MSQNTNLQTVQNLEPQQVWSVFAGLAAVPRPSRKEEAIRNHMRDIASSHSFKVHEDSTGNLLVEVPATKGCERAPLVVLQAHLDMVCEKNSDVDHNFDNDPIELVLDSDAEGLQIIRANGTTLGADNGIGMALAFAAASSSDVTHGPLELLLTMDEETGMTGAKALTSNSFKGRRLINLDSEEDDALYIGCAGGFDVTLSWAFEATQIEDGAEVVSVKITGLSGGHSGCDIHLNRLNANKLLAQVFNEAGNDKLRLVDADGGSLRNAIPREATITVAGGTGLCDSLKKAAEHVQEHSRKYGEPDCSICVAAGPDDAAALGAVSAEETRDVLRALTAIPFGPLAIVPDIPGLVQTSNNLSTLKTRRDNEGQLYIEIGCLTRSSSDVQIHDAVGQIRAVGQLAGAKVRAGNDYPGWQPNIDSTLLSVCGRIYKELFGEAAHVTAIHAGLECGIIGERVGGEIDMISFGPRIEGAHSPDERVYVKSVQKTWTYLKAVLAELTK